MGYGLCVLIGAVIGGAGGALVWLICRIKSTRVIEDLRSRLAVAEEKNFRIPNLELTLAKNRTEIANLTGQVAALKEDILQKADKIAMLSLRLVEQTEAAKESNLGAVEESLLADISRRQGGARTTTHEVSQIADSEQLAPALPHRDRALEELISPDEPEPQPEQLDIAPAWQTEAAAESDDSDPDVAESDGNIEQEDIISLHTEADIAPPSQTEPDAESDDLDPDAAESDGNIEQEDIISLHIEADIASLAQRLDEEISFQFDDADNDDDSDAISLAAATPAESPLRFEIEEIPAPPAQSQDKLALKKKLNTESPPAQTRKRVPLTRSLYFPTQGITVRYNPIRGRIK